MSLDRALPGLEPSAVSIRFQRYADDSVDLWVWEGDHLRYVRIDQATHYEQLTRGEASDVLCAVLDGLGLGD